MQLDLGNNIRQLRRRDKRTQEQLAEGCVPLGVWWKLPGHESDTLHR